MRFRAEILLNGRTATGIEVPESVVTELAGGKRPRVRITIAGYTYRSSIAPMGGRFLMPVSAEVRERAGVAAGDEVDVDVELDTEPREVTVPPDFAAALAADAEAARAFAKLPYSHKQRHVIAIEQAKKPETRQRRIAGAISALRAGR